MERTVTVKRPGLEPMKVKVRIWNDTVSNLTLMALGLQSITTTYYYYYYLFFVSFLFYFYFHYHYFLLFSMAF